MPSKSWKLRWTPIFEHHPNAELLRSPPGLDLIFGTRVLGKPGDDRTRLFDAASQRV